jgi:3-deoxy-D-manno-octulosonate 8-phosphate phosphatase (KDO 8-P phosphatase)
MVENGRFTPSLVAKAQAIRLLLTDVDGVLTDGSVYYSAAGEEMKRFSIRDGMGVERLRQLTGIEVGIVTGEKSPAVLRRAEKLKIAELHVGIRRKSAVLADIFDRLKLQPKEIAYIGDDTNDLEVMRHVGLTAAPADAYRDVLTVADYVCQAAGGQGAFREFVELIIAARQEPVPDGVEGVAAIDAVAVNGRGAI